jgi:5-formyltetrahydrofolate cyclo-ligase
LKKNLRAELLNRRDSIPHSERTQKDRAIKKSLFDLKEFKNARTILMYVSFRSEVDTTSYLADIVNMGKQLVVPLVKSKQKTLALYKIKSTSELSPGYMGIPEPTAGKDCLISLNEIELAVIPGSGFDPEGNRLGYGGGYYDRLLSKAETHITTVALAFEEQIKENIPAEPHDIKMDIIITDKRVIHRS